MVLSRIAVPFAVGSLALSACGGDDSAEPGTREGGAVIVATTSIWADVTRQVACTDDVEVRTLIPPGGDAHAFEPSLRDRQLMDDATLVVANGAGLEETLAPTLAAVTAGGGRVFEIAEHVAAPPEPAGTPVATTGDDHADDHDPDDDHGHEGTDPHVWFDPTLVAEALPALGDALVEAGLDRAAIERCVDTAAAALTALDEELTTTLAGIPAADRVLVTNHDALGYFARRYDFEILGTVLPSTSTFTEASPSQLDALAVEISAAGVPAIFTETLHSSGDARALADRLGVEVVELYTDSLGEEGSGAETYAGLLRTDAQRLADALGG